MVFVVSSYLLYICRCNRTCNCGTLFRIVRMLQFIPGALCSDYTDT